MVKETNIVAQVNIGIQRTSMPKALRTLMCEAEFSDIAVTDFEERRCKGGDWGLERTLIASLSFEDLRYLKETLREVCVILGEDAIAVKTNRRSKKGFLVFNPSYVGERYDFNNDYFLDYKKHYLDY
tara:strand:+ start:252 stop:632 length:381 start_codon:yes stop_codon:yes gene_type:complete